MLMLLVAGVLLGSFTRFIVSVVQACARLCGRHATKPYVFFDPVTSSTEA